MSDSFQRDLLRGSLDLMVLSVLADEPQYGYSIQKQIRDVSQGRVDLKAGTLYPLLHRLEADKLIRCKWDDSTGRRRKWYELTKSGQKRLQTQSQEWYRYVECIGQLLTPVLPKLPNPA
ncbi:MAG: helix-turn-helix transcriptional regulator [Planctomycetaceae bacterium]|nr:helix-turn-helix transcriptional regulator [Planctomycetales bacterium]MCB9921426.1 helix-turn-helix transcriptional regulator [Planctomycetaceae bacterium]